eukprot:33184_1
MLNTFQKMLKNQNINWDKLSNKMIDALVILIKQQQNTNKVTINENENKNDEKEIKYDTTMESNEYITKYGKELFSYFCSNKNTSSIWINDYKSLPNKLQTVLFSESLDTSDDNEDLLSFIPMTKLFSNLKEIKLNELNTRQFTKESKDYIFAVMEYINNSNK